MCFVLVRLFFIVILHLRVDDVHQRSLMVLQHIPYIVFGGQIRLKVFHHLACKFVEKIGMLVIVHVIEIDQPSNEVVFQSLLWNDSVATDKAVLGMVVQVSNQNVLRNGLEMHSLQVKIEVRGIPR